MSVVPHTWWPRSAFFNSQWTQESMPLTAFWWDPFDELDMSLMENTMPTWVQWLHKPEWLSTMPCTPTKKVLQKWRAMIDISGFNFPLKSIKVELKPNNKLFIWGKEEVKENEENIWFKEFKKCFDLPCCCGPEKFVCFIWGNLLIVEVPIMDAAVMKELMPVFATEKKEWTMNITLPAGIDATKCDIILKDRDVFIKFWDTTVPQPTTSWTTWWSAWIYKKVCKLPENTKWNEMKFTLNNNMLTIWAPLWDLEQWQQKTTTVMPSMVDWTWNWKQWATKEQKWTGQMPWTWTKDMTTKGMPWSWPMTNTMSTPMPWWPMNQTH